jgi:hypothetical protein
MKGGGRVMVFIVEPCLVPSSKQGFQGKIKEAGVRVDFETHTCNNLSVSGTRLILQKEIVLEYREIRRNS